MIKILKIAFFISILLSLGIFIAHTDLHQIWISIGLMGWHFLWLLLLTFLAYAIGTIGWYYCLGEQKKCVPLGKLFVIRLVSESVSLFNPTSIIGGDFLKILLLKPTGANEKTIVSSVLISRGLMMLSQPFLFSIATIIIYFSTTDPHIKQILRTVMIAILGISLGIVVLIVFLMKMRRKIHIPKNPPFLSKLAEQLKLLIGHLQLAYEQDKKNLVLAFLHFSLHWFIGAMEFYLILYFLHSPISIVQSVFMDMGVIFFKSAGAFIPAQLGVEEYGNKVMLSMIGIASPAIWLSVSILRRARQLCWIAFGALCYLCVFRKFAQLQSAV